MANYNAIFKDVGQGNRQIAVQELRLRHFSPSARHAIHAMSSVCGVVPALKGNLYFTSKQEHIALALYEQVYTAAAQVLQVTHHGVLLHCIAVASEQGSHRPSLRLLLCTPHQLLILGLGKPQ